MSDASIPGTMANAVYLALLGKYGAAFEGGDPDRRKFAEAIEDGVLPFAAGDPPQLGPFGQLVFEWNRVDTSQFEPSPAFFASLSGSAGTLSVVASAEHGNVLRWAHGAGSRVEEVLLAVDPLPFTDERRDMTIEIETFDTTGGGSVSYQGAAFLCDDSAANFHGFVHAASVGANAGQLIVNNGVAEAPASGLSGSGTKYSRYQIIGAKPSGGAPYLTERFEGFGVSTDVNLILRTGSSAAAAGNVTNRFGNSSVLGASWNPLACDRWGLAVRTLSGGAPFTTWDILNIRVYVK